MISAEDADFMRTFEAEVLEMLTVDDFAYDAFAKNKSTLIDHNENLRQRPNSRSRRRKILSNSYFSKRYQ
ncbi:hypothetical protein HORIV_29570 [Vreelandella olivaria]|uniref:Uncharacterized protein n=1 Tax=Vreelandella olivaria TaxID=390919 RepID=A0ABN5X126_9GAMM|nr:hypothetical protein HORIV_29570 [Halomonas olivaria]